MSDAPRSIGLTLPPSTQKVRPADTRREDTSIAMARRKPFLPEKAILAIAVVADVALLCRGRFVTGEMLARRRGLSPRYLEPILEALVQHGILKGIRGRRGGYTLGREQDRISAADILRATLDEIRADSCARSHGLDRIVAKTIEDMEDAFSEALARISLSDLTGSRMRTRAE